MSLLSRLFSGLTRARPTTGAATAPRAGLFSRHASTPTPGRRPTGWSGPTTMDPAQYLREVEQDVSRQRQEDRFSWQDTNTWTNPHQAVVSSNLRSVAYDSSHLVMQIIFTKAGRNNGDTYNYTEVGPGVFYGLMNAQSKGRYHHQHIRCSYSYSDLSGRSELKGCDPHGIRGSGPMKHGGTGLPLKVKGRWW